MVSFSQIRPNVEFNNCKIDPIPYDSRCVCQIHLIELLELKA